jgi:hypothetical protein
MTNQQTPSRAMNITLWIAQILLAASLLMGTIMKFLPIEKIATMMPWTGQVPAWLVRLLGLMDLIGAMGLILPSLLRIKPQLTAWSAVCVVVLMLCAIVFHISRGEAPVIGVNIFYVVIALFIAWGRSKKAPIAAK